MTLKAFCTSSNLSLCTEALNLPTIFEHWHYLRTSLHPQLNSQNCQFTPPPSLREIPPFCPSINWILFFLLNLLYTYMVTHFSEYQAWPHKYTKIRKQHLSKINPRNYYRISQPHNMLHWWLQIRIQNRSRIFNSELRYFFPLSRNPVSVFTGKLRRYPCLSIITHSATS